MAAYSLLACHPSDAIILKKIRAEFKHRDLLCLQPHQWLNDEAVNRYMQLVHERDSFITRSSPNPRNPNIFMSSFFYHKLVNFNGGFSYDGVRKWTKRIDIFCSNQIYFPININRENWAHVCVSMLSKKIKYFDSLVINFKLPFGFRLELSIQPPWLTVEPARGLSRYTST